MKFQILSKDPGSSARAGRIETARGPVDTPVFMPVGTAGSVKSLSPDELESLGRANHSWKYLSPLPAPGGRKSRPPGRASQIHGLGSPGSDGQRRFPGLQPRQDKQDRGRGRPFPIAHRRLPPPSYPRGGYRHPEKPRGRHHDVL